MSADGWLADHHRELRHALDALRADACIVDHWGRRLAGTLADGGRLLVAGNGGSAAEAQHLTAELVGRFLDERRPLSAICLSAETSSLTAIVNDYGAEEMFARQVQAHGRAGDILLLLSTSGRSPNVLRAAERAAELDVAGWALTGPGPNPLAARCDEAICVEASSTAAVQAVHLVIVHAICAAIDAQLPAAELPAAPVTEYPQAPPQARPWAPTQLRPAGHRRPENYPTEVTA